MQVKLKKLLIIIYRLKLMFLEHWNLYDALYYSNYIMAKL